MDGGKALSILVTGACAVSGTSPVDWEKFFAPGDADDASALSFAERCGISSVACETADVMVVLSSTGTGNGVEAKELPAGTEAVSFLKGYAHHSAPANRSNAAAAAIFFHKGKTVAGFTFAGISLSSRLCICCHPC